MNKFGRLEEVPLRDYWKNEPQNFTKWLSEKENLDLLGKTIGISLETEQTEAEVGDFYADILAKDENGNYVIIENQLETTDHTHLGQIIAYASGKEAKTIVWIAKKFRDEFKKAIEWLNEHTDDDINFFAIEIELWKIGNSDPAPKFAIVEQPNEWAKVFKKTRNVKETSETELKRLEFWTGLKDYALENKINFFTHKPSKDHWYNISMGISGAYISLTALIQTNKITCSFWIDDNKELFDNLESYKNDIEKDLGYSLNWDRKSDNKKASCIIIDKQNDFTNEDNNDAYEWLIEKAIQFQNTFGNYWKLFEKN
jgi:hypothetical protein